MKNKNRIIASGKRKRAVARAVLTDGDGKITLNGRDYNSLSMFNRLRISEPIEIAKKVLGGINFNVEIHARGGGEKGQTDASRLALAKAISKFANSKELTDAFLAYDRNLLVADIRRKEPNKPGDSKARSKRQTSYR